MFSHAIVQWNCNIISYSRYFLTTFCTSFTKRVHNSKETVTVQGLLLLTVGYLFISTFSFLLYLHTTSWRYKRDYLHASIDIFFILSSILLTRCRNIRLFYITFVLTMQKRSWFEPGPLSPLFLATPLIRQIEWEVKRKTQFCHYHKERSFATNYFIFWKFNFRNPL